MTQSPHSTESADPLGFNFDLPFVVDIPVGCGRERVAAMIEAVTGSSLLGPCYPRAGRQERARRVAEIRAALGAQQRRAKRQRVRWLRARPPDGLRTKAEAAAKLGCSIKTLDGYVSTGALRYVALGHGKKRQRKMFTDPDLNEFIASQTRKDVPCPSIRTETAARRISTTTSKCEVIGFTARRNARRAAKPKK